MTEQKPPQPPAKPAPPLAVMQQQGAVVEINQGETAGTAMAAHATAMVRARVFLAKAYPRDWDQVKFKLMAAVERPGFAGHKNEAIWGAGWYKKPGFGDKAEGFSIRFAEEAARHLGNLDIQQSTVFDDDEKRIVLVNVLDLESNNCWPTMVTVAKTIERNQYKRDGDEVLRVRTNKKGEKVFVVRASEDETRMKEQRHVAFAVRNGILRLIPGDILGDCRTRILQIREGAAAQDPDGEKKRILAGFAQLKVQPKDLKDYLGHEVGQCTAAELVSLRDLWEDLKEGKVVWADVLAEAKAARGEPQGPPEVDPLQGIIQNGAVAAPPAPQPPASLDDARREVEQLVQKQKDNVTPMRARLAGRKKAAEAAAKEAASEVPPCSSCGAVLGAEDRKFSDSEGKPLCADCWERA